MQHSEKLHGHKDHQGAEDEMQPVLFFAEQASYCCGDRAETHKDCSGAKRKSDSQPQPSLCVMYSSALYISDHQRHS